MNKVLIRTGAALGLSFLINATGMNQAFAATVSCPAEMKTGTEFPLTDASGVTWHDSNSINFNIDYKVVCTWKKPKASKRKEGHVCTYSEFSECSVPGTPAGTLFYLTDYKPQIKAPAKK